VHPRPARRTHANAAASAGQLHIQSEHLVSVFEATALTHARTRTRWPSRLASRVAAALKDIGAGPAKSCACMPTAVSNGAWGAFKAEAMFCSLDADESGCGGGGLTHAPRPSLLLQGMHKFDVYVSIILWSWYLMSSCLYSSRHGPCIGSHVTASLRARLGSQGPSFAPARHSWCFQSNAELRLHVSVRCPNCPVHVLRPRRRHHVRFNGV